MSVKFEKCPFCGEIAFGKLEPSNGTAYILNEVDQVNNKILQHHGQTVEIHGCYACKKALLVIPTLIVKPQQSK